MFKISGLFITLLLAGCGGGSAGVSTEVPTERVIMDNGLYQAHLNYILKPDRSRFVAKGVTLFDYLFVSYEPRTDWTVRNPLGKTNVTRGEPTYFASQAYRNYYYMTGTIDEVLAEGINFIRIAVEPAMEFTLPYTHNGVDYPSDMDMLDEIITYATSQGMVIQLQNGNDNVDIATNISFLSMLGNKYKNNPAVWINTANEINGVKNNGASVDDPALWEYMQVAYLKAIRATGFRNPVAIDPPGYATRIDLIVDKLLNNPVFSTDPNLVINTHYYPSFTSSAFSVSELSNWSGYTGSFPIIVGEAGINYSGAKLDPNLSYPAPAYTPEWNNVQVGVTGFLTWADNLTAAGGLNGVVGMAWRGYVPGAQAYDQNSMHYDDGNLTTWGVIYLNR